MTDRHTAQLLNHWIFLPLHFTFFLHVITTFLQTITTFPTFHILPCFGARSLLSCTNTLSGCMNVCTTLATPCLPAPHPAHYFPSCPPPAPILPATLTPQRPPQTLTRSVTPQPFRWLSTKAWKRYQAWFWHQILHPSLLPWKIQTQVALLTRNCLNHWAMTYWFNEKSCISIAVSSNLETLLPAACPLRLLRLNIKARHEFLNTNLWSINLIAFDIDWSWNIVT